MLQQDTKDFHLPHLGRKVQRGHPLPIGMGQVYGRLPLQHQLHQG